MMTKHEFNRYVRFMAFLDAVFHVVTPIFCALALLAIFSISIWRK